MPACQVPRHSTNWPGLTTTSSKLPKGSRSLFIAALALILFGVLITAGASARPFDLAVPVARGWHVTIFPPPLWVGAMMLLGGIVMLALVRR